MFQMRSLTTGFLVASLGVAAGLAVMTSPNLASAGDCGKLTVAAVKKVCEGGGEKAVKDAMKKAQKAAKAAGAKIDGKDIKCTSCHEDQKTYKLKGNAKDDFKAHMEKHF